MRFRPDQGIKGIEDALRRDIHLLRHAGGGAEGGESTQVLLIIDGLDVLLAGAAAAGVSSSAAAGAVGAGAGAGVGEMIRMITSLREVCTVTYVPLRPLLPSALPSPPMLQYKVTS